MNTLTLLGLIKSDLIDDLKNSEELETSFIADELDALDKVIDLIRERHMRLLND